MIEMMLGIELTIASYYDKKYLGIPKVFLLTIALLNIVIVVCKGSVVEIGTFLGIGFGFLLLSIAKCTREAIGYGDAYLFLLVGMVIGGRDIFIIFLMTTFLIALYGMALCIRKGVSRKYEIPMVPFILITYIIYCWL
ncbi:MAG: prepilin peptidase [Eubacteriales bacterium]